MFVRIKIVFALDVVATSLSRFLWLPLRRRFVDAEKWLYRRGMLEASSLPFPDFLGIGAQKAGTTWLYENLRSHPDLFLPEDKELHYFDWNYNNLLWSYTKHFRAAGDRTKGEITPGYSILPVERIRDIHAFRPDLKLIFLMRNPIERAWSQARMNLVRFTDRAFEDVPDAEFYDHFEDPRSVKRGDYLQILSNWTTVFPENQIHIDFFERVAEDPRGLLRDVFRFLDVRTDIEWGDLPFNEVVFSNPRREMPQKFRQYLEEFYEDDIQALHKRFGLPATKWLKDLSGCSENLSHG